MNPATPSTPVPSCADHTLSITPPADFRFPDVRAKTIVGYCWPWSVRPGDEVEFMVSSEVDADYAADLVRIGCGDSITREDRYRDTAVAADFAGAYRGRRQSTTLGSSVHVAPAAVLDRLRNFTIQAFVYPTRLPSDGGIEQHLVSRWDAARELGWSLSIDERDRVVLRLSGASGTHVSVLQRQLTDRRWHLVSASIDLDAGRVGLRCARPATIGAPHDAAPAELVEARLSAGFDIAQAGPLLFAGRPVGVDRAGIPVADSCFNGRLDRVRLSGTALDADAVEELASATAPPRAASVGFWDFAVDPGGARAVDLSGNELHGAVVNLPQRAVAGVAWDGSSQDWTATPGQFSAIHFHDDDLYDAGWEVAFTFRVPDDLATGVYAARLTQAGDEDYVPFFVLPPRGTTTASVAVLLPTATYTAYTNVTSILTLRATTVRTGADGETRVVEGPVAERTLSCEPRHLRTLLDHRPGWSAGVYAYHSDGTLRTYASQRHPNMSVKPKGMNWTLVADSYLLDWLERTQIPFDVITDDVLEREGAELLTGYQVVLTGNHPEYYTRTMRAAVETFQERGGRLMYLGGNGFYWVTSYPGQIPGVIEVRKSPAVAEYERRHASDGVPGGLWRDNGRAPQGLVGVGTSGVAMDCVAGYRRLPDSDDPRAAFIFAGVEGERFGESGVIGGAAAGQEVDRIAPELGTPVGALHVARADALHRSHPEAGESSPRPMADVVFFSLPGGGAVFTVGSMAWIGALVDEGAGESDVSRITENVLRRFLDPAGFGASAD